LIRQYIRKGSDLRDYSDDWTAPSILFFKSISYSRFMVILN
jgi:hypothetical protein